MVTPVTLISYMLYTLDAATIVRFHSRHLYLTCVFVVFGIFRYLYLIHTRKLGGSPTELVISDISLQIAILGWILTFVVLVYLS